LEKGIGNFVDCRPIFLIQARKVKCVGLAPLWREKESWEF